LYKIYEDIVGVSIKRMFEKYRLALVNPGKSPLAPLKKLSITHKRDDGGGWDDSE
jgi:hypothetical protein